MFDFELTFKENDFVSLILNPHAATNVFQSILILSALLHGLVRTPVDSVPQSDADKVWK